MAGRQPKQTDRYASTSAVDLGCDLASGDRVRGVAIDHRDILSDYATLMVEILKDNARPEAAAVYGAMDMPWAKLVGQVAQAYRK
jgi:hypothetical protein